MSATQARRIGRYRLVEVVGTGAFATVHRAVDERLEDTVALKVLAENHSLNPEIRERFMAELAAEAQAGYSNEAIRREALVLAEDGVTTSNECFARAEGRKADEPWPDEHERWWK